MYVNDPLCCSLYYLDDGERGVPPREGLLRALAAAVQGHLFMHMWEVKRRRFISTYIPMVWQAVDVRSFNNSQIYLPASCSRSATPPPSPSSPWASGPRGGCPVACVERCVDTSTQLCTSHHEIYVYVLKQKKKQQARALGKPRSNCTSTGSLLPSPSRSRRGPSSSVVVVCVGEIGVGVCVS